MIITRKEAKEKGQKHYFTGKPCKRNHIAKRLVSSLQCIECSKEINKNKKEYFADWRNKNRELIKQTNKKYYNNNKQKVKDYNKKWREQNKEKYDLWYKNWHEKNKIKLQEYNKTYHKEYYENNKYKFKLKRVIRRARILSATPKWADLEKIALIYLNCPKGMEVDHIIPLKNKNVCGLHVEDNLQYLTIQQNRSKGNKY